MGFAEPADSGGIRNGYPLMKICLHIFKDNFQALQRVAVRMCLLRRHVRRQRIEKGEQLPLDGELVSMPKIPTDLIHSVKAGRQPQVRWTVRRKMAGKEKLSLRQRPEQLLRTDISLRRHKHGELKNNIFVFHGVLAKLANGMEPPRRDNDNIPLRYPKWPQVNRDNPPPLLDIDNLHIIMPVGRHQMEIQRDGAEINIERKIFMAMNLGFLGILIF
jgi:hypothetical protein